jgi:hypothetical protein
MCLGQAAVPSSGAPLVGAPLADPLAAWENAAGQAERWADVARSAGGAAAPGSGCTPASTVRWTGLGHRRGAEER